MSSDFHLHFINKKQTFELDFHENMQASKDTVLVNGRNYAVQGEAYKIAWLKSKLPELTKAGISLEELKAKLIDLGAQEIKASSKTHVIGIDFLKSNTPKDKVETVSPTPLGKWMFRELSELPNKRKLVADKYWSLHTERFKKIAKAEKHLDRLKRQRDSISRSKKKNLTQQIEIHEKRLVELQKPDAMFLDFLQGTGSKSQMFEKTFAKAVRKHDKNLFDSLFDRLSTRELYSINHEEKLEALPMTSLSDLPVTISEEDVQNINDYMRDSNFSGIVAITDGKKNYTISSSNILPPNTPFAIHSVGKVFTGILALRLIQKGYIPKEVLEQPIQLDQKVIDALPQKIQKQLSRTTLHQVMLHQGGYGDYLLNYTSAIEKAIEEGKPIPIIKKPEDFLKYADHKLVNLGPSGDAYSNLGILLVGLSIRHLYNTFNGDQLEYQDILHRFVLQPAGIKTFETHMPANGCVNLKDKASPYIVGGPAGGYWSTAEDLLKMGEWLKENCQDETFMELLNQYGGEFYENREIAHGGSLDYASAHLSHRLDNGVTIAIVSNTSEFKRASTLCDVIQEHILTV